MRLRLTILHITFHKRITVARYVTENILDFFAFFLSFFFKKIIANVELLVFDHFISRSTNTYLLQILLLFLFNQVKTFFVMTAVESVLLVILL